MVQSLCAENWTFSFCKEWNWSSPCALCGHFDENNVDSADNMAGQWTLMNIGQIVESHLGRQKL